MIIKLYKLIILFIFPVWFYAVLKTEEDIGLVAKIASFLFPLGLYFSDIFYNFVVRNSNKWGWESETKRTEELFHYLILALSLCFFIGVIRYLLQFVLIN